MDVQHNHTSSVTGKGSHTVDTYEGHKLTQNVGKGVDFSFNSGTRAFAINRRNNVQYATPQTVIVADGGMPLAVEKTEAYSNPGANSTGVLVLGNGPVYTNAYNLTAGGGQLGSLLGHHHGR